MNSSNKRIIYLFVAATFVVIIFGPVKSVKYSDMEKKMVKIQSKLVTIPYDSLFYYSKFKDDKMEQAKFPYKMIIYLDSIECSTCSIKMLFEWNELLSLETKKKVGFVWIISSQNHQAIIDAYNNSALKHGIYIDTCRIFSRKNSHIPQEPTFHTFLCDEEGNVVLVGNPINNPKINKMFKKIINYK